MKAKKILFLVAGIFNAIIGGIGVFMGLLMLVFNGLINKMFDSTYEIVEQFVESLAKGDAEYEYLLSNSKSENIDFVMKAVTIVSVLFLIIGLIYIAFGVFNIIFAKNHIIITKNKKYLGTLLVVFSWLLMWFNLANILTTIAVYLKSKDKTEKYNLYSVKNTKS